MRLLTSQTKQEIYQITLFPLFFIIYIRFLLQLVKGCTVNDKGLATLSVVETNAFRYLTHLALQFVPASDAYLKKYLAECMLGLKVSC